MTTLPADSATTASQTTLPTDPNPVPVKLTWKDYLKNPTFIATHLLTILSALVFMFTTFHFGPGVAVAAGLKPYVTVTSAEASIFFQGIWSVHHTNLVKALIAGTRNVVTNLVATHTL